jgi:hypothetical protein
MIRECLEYLKQAATNPNFDNDYELNFRDEEQQPAVKETKDGGTTATDKDLTTKVDASQQSEKDEEEFKSEIQNREIRIEA